MKALLINLFKLGLKIIYFFIKLFPTNKNKVVFISRQSNKMTVDFEMIIERLKLENPNIKIECITKRIGKGIVEYIKYAFCIISQMYHIATSKVCVIDSYNIPVCVLKHKKSLTVLQIWHSIGKIKKSGYQTLDTPSGRSKKIAELMCMHKNYDAIIAGGKAFNKYYVEGFNTTEDKILNYGLPRIDRLLEESKQKKSRILEKYPELKKKKIVYYAPTFRTYDVNGPKELIDKYNPRDFALIVTNHPNQNLDIDESKVYKLSLNEFSNTEILSICDYLIADYGSIALEAAVLKKKTLYYLYDYKEYLDNNGINLDPKKVMPTCTFEKAEDLLKVIKNDTYDEEALEKYVKKYLPKEIGTSTEKITDYILQHLK